METYSSELFTEFVDTILETSSVKITPTGSLYIDDSKILIKDISSWMISFCRKDENKKFITLLTQSPSLNIFLETIKIEIKKIQSSHRLSVYKGADDTIRGFSYEGLVPFISVENSSKIIFFDKKSKQITNLDYDTYSQTVDKDYKIRPMPARIEFNPYRPEQIYIGEYLGQECTHINTYRKPQWQFNKKITIEEAKEFSQLPIVIDDFFTHLFPSDTCKEFVYDWLHFALVSRCETYLVMNGAKGVGKNVLSNILCSSLVGSDNHKIAHKGALDQFNVILSECRMIVFDEFKIVDDDSINALKRFANSDQMIERKGIDVNKTEKTYNSYIICNNSVTDMRIEWDDRRFSVTDLTDKKLEDIWSKQKLDLLISIVQEPTSKEMINFGYWLLYRKPKVMTSPFTVYKGDHFYRLCYSSFPEWAKMIIDEVTNNTSKNYYDELELKLLFKERTNGIHRFPNSSKVQDFIKNYKHNGENYLGHIERDERSYYLQVNEFFVKTTNDNTGIDWQDSLL